MTNPLTQPWLHFLGIGFLLFCISQWIWPPVKPAVGPLPEAYVETLVDQWVKTTGRSPSTEQMDKLIQFELDQEILYQEGLNLELHRYDSVILNRLRRNMEFLGLEVSDDPSRLLDQALEMELHLGDEIIRRRIIQLVENILLEQKSLEPISDNDIVMEFETNKHKYRREKIYSIDHIFFAPDKQDDIATVQQQISTLDIDPREAQYLGSLFLGGYSFKEQSREQLTAHFGSQFSDQFESLNAEEKSWVGPIESAYGFHLIWVDQIIEPRDATLEEVRKKIAGNLSRERRREALATSLLALRHRYKVIL